MLSSCLLRLGLLALLLAGCSPSATPVSAPTPQIVRVAITSALRYVQPALAECAAEQPGAGLVVQETATSALDYSTLTLRWGALGLEERIASGELQAYQIGINSLVVVTHPENPLPVISLEALRAVYRGEGDPAAPLQAYQYPVGEDSALVVAASLAAGEALENTTWLAPDPAALREVIASTPQAIGALPRGWLDGSVQAVTVTGMDASAWQVPILAIVAQPLTPAEHSLLGCLQARLGV